METKTIGNYEEVGFEAMALIREVINECPEIEELNRINIKYLFSTKPRKSRGMVILGSAKVCPEKDAFLHDYKGIVIFDKETWECQPEYRKPLILHELSHFAVDPETGNLVSVDHDITEFYAVYKRYGDWQGQIKLIEMKQLELNLV